MKFKKNLVLFGAGFYGKKAYNRFRDEHNVRCVLDNNADRIDKGEFEIPVVSPESILDYDLEDTDVVICSRYFSDMAVQLVGLGISDFYVQLEGFTYHFDSNDVLLPVEIQHAEIYKKNNAKKTILFLQNTACIRTHKIAMLMKDAGYNVCLLYTIEPPINEYAEYANIYENVWGFTSVNGIIDFINRSEFDLIHSSNEPDILTCAALQTDKPVVYDTHDMQSIRGEIDTNGLMLEYFANRFSDGNIYVSEGVKKIAEQKFHIEGKDVFVLENLVYDQVDVAPDVQKLSERDGEIHCVYEGGIVGDAVDHQRYFEKIWMKIAEQGIHIHFYSGQNYRYCKLLDSKSRYLHYEGNVGGTRLIREMTKYDCGLVLFNVTEKNRTHLDKTTANKIYEYLNAGLPLIVGDLRSHKDFVEKYGIGVEINMDDIRHSISSALEIKIDKDFIRNNGFTQKSKMHELVQFYEQVMSHYSGRTRT